MPVPLRPDTIEFAMALGPAGEIIRLAGEEGQARRERVVASLRDRLSRYLRPEGIWMDSSSWFVRARNPVQH